MITCRTRIFFKNFILSIFLNGNRRGKWEDGREDGREEGGKREEGG